MKKNGTYMLVVAAIVGVMSVGCTVVDKEPDTVVTPPSKTTVVNPPDNNVIVTPPSGGTVSTTG